MTAQERHEWLPQAFRLVQAEVPIDKARFLSLLEDAIPQFLESCCADLTEASPEIVGFAMSYNQSLATLALARLLKARRPTLPVLVGGGSVFGIPGEEYVRRCRQIDIAFVDEADPIITRVVRALTEAAPLDDIPGIVYRDPVTGLVH